MQVLESELLYPTISLSKHTHTLLPTVLYLENKCNYFTSVAVVFESENNSYTCKLPL